ncbi:hypothetical protein [Streptosporangium longisporum]|uniref:Uncharacterized protein n=1 Tax=Streptosporangium longisporum TaxID=46187 RepID=A0ABP6LGR9_9ACTN
MDLTPLDRLLAGGHALTLRMDGEAATVDDTGAMIDPGWGPYVQATLIGHDDRIVADASAATVAAALAAVLEEAAPLASPPWAAGSTLGGGRLIDGSGGVTVLRMDNEWATPGPGVRQVFGWIVGDSGGIHVGRQQVRVELPSGTVLAGRGLVEVTRGVGSRKGVKVYIYD